MRFLRFRYKRRNHRGVREIYARLHRRVVIVEITTYKQTMFSPREMQEQGR